jgi:hypothetical protein
VAAAALGSTLYDRVDRLSDVAGKFTDGRLREPLRAYRDRS